MNELLVTSPPHSGGELPTGTIISFAGNVEIDGWCICDGRELSRTLYKNLFNVIGTTYGEGDGSTTFNLPNFINKTLWGNTVAGVEKEAGLPNIVGHYVMRPNLEYIVLIDGAFSQEAYNSSQKYAPVPSTATSSTKVTFDASGSNPIYGNAETVQPPAITVRMMIKL